MDRIPAPFGRPGVVGVTVVAVADDAAARAVAERVLGVADVGPEAFASVRDHGGELAEVVAAKLVDAAREGLRGDAMVGVGADADLLEFALVLEAFLEQSDDVPCLLLLRELIVVSSVAEIAGAFDRIGGDDGGGPDFVGVDLLATRLEMATAVVLTDLDGTDSGMAGGTVALLRALNPNATVLDAAAFPGETPPRPPLVRSLAQRLASSAGWQRALADDPDRSASSGNTGMVVFRDPRPFHPARLADAISDRLSDPAVGRIQRSKGLFRLATRAERVGAWSGVGDALELDPTAMLSWDVESPAGQELVFFGTSIDAATLSAVLTSCLLTSEELLAGPDAWAHYADPFPVWDLEHEH